MKTQKPLDRDSYLENHPVIRHMEKETAITLADLLARKIYIVPAEQRPDPDTLPEHAEYWPLSYSLDIDDQEYGRLKGEVAKHCRLLQDAALVVMKTLDRDSYLTKHPVIQFMEKNTGITLDDLLQGKVHIVVPEQSMDILNSELAECLVRDGEFNNFDQRPIYAEYWPLSYSLDIDDQEYERIKSAVKGHVRLIQDAALVVWGVSDLPRTDGQRDLLSKEREAIEKRIDDKTLSKKNKTIAEKPRNPDMTEIIGILACENGGAKTLWPHLYSALDQEGMDPREGESASGEPQYIYTTARGRKKTITLKTFGNKLSKARNSKT